MAVAANRYTSDYFLTNVRRKAHIPPAQTTFLDADLLAIANDELDTAILRQVRTARENYWLVNLDLTANTNSLYDFAYRAIGGAINDIHIVIGTSIYPVSRCETNEQFSTVTSPTGYWSYMIQGNQFKILPTNVTGGVVRQWYAQRPNTIVTVASCAQVTAVNQAGGVLTFASLPATFVSNINYDCIQDQPHFNWRFFDQSGTVSGTTVTFASLPTDVNGNQLIQVGDWLALAGQTPVPQIPMEFQPLLVQRTVLKYYEAQGYDKKIPLAQKKLDDMEKDVFELINPRVSSEPKRVVADSNVIGGYRRWRAWRAT